MMILDATIVNVALPDIQHDLGFSQSSPDLGARRVPDRVRLASCCSAAASATSSAARGMFLAGIALFTASSLVCGFASSEGMLIAARFVQGLGAAISASAILALIVVEFPDPRERVRAMSAYTFVSVAGGSLGLLAGGLLTAGAELALDLLRQPARSACWPSGSARIVLPRDRGLGPEPRRRRPRLRR